jgi:ABC-type antimicrobial peptide transport system permease subunit
MALGARDRDVRAMVLREGMLLALAGVLVGIGAAVGLTRLMSALLFGVGAADPLTYATVAAGLTAVAMLATWLPARRATRVDPIEALRWK